MAGRKYKPALYELVAKGPLKPDKGGKLLTPKWFYGSKTGTVTPLAKDGQAPVVRLIPPTMERPKDWAPKQEEPTEPVREEAAVEEVGPTEVSGQAVEGADRAGGLAAIGRATEKVKQVSARLTKEKLELSATYVTVGVVLVGLLFSWVLFYGLGHMAGRSGAEQAVVPSQEEAPEKAQQGSLSDVTSGPVRPGLLAPAERAGSGQAGVGGSAVPRPAGVTTTVAASAEITTSGASAARAEPVVVEPAVKVVDKGSRLVVLTWRSPAELSPVMAFFAKKGIETEVGRFGTNFVLFTKESFGTGDDARVREVKEDIRRYGALYRDEKPATAPVFLAQSFATAYPVKSESIKRLSD